MPYFKLNLKNKNDSYEGRFAVVHAHKGDIWDYGFYREGGDWEIRQGWNQLPWKNEWAYIRVHGVLAEQCKYRGYKFNNTIYEIWLNDIESIEICSKQFYHEHKVIVNEPEKNSRLTVRDSQKQKVYDSETFYFKTEKLNDKDVLALVDLAMEGELVSFLKNNFTSAVSAPVDVELCPSKKLKTAKGGYSGITLPDWAKNELIVLHELAHTLMHRIFSFSERAEKRIQSHGAEFCYIYLSLVWELIPEWYDELIRRFDSKGVKYLAEFSGKSLP